MRIQFNSDLTKRVIVDSSKIDWQASPSPGVWRKRFELDGSLERGLVTSLTRFDPGAIARQHDHPEGEEILVLKGTFSDKTGCYPVGSYLLNPEGFSHSPFSKNGCTIFVKLRQYGGEGRQQVRLNIQDISWSYSSTPGIDRKLLYAQEGFPERIFLERWHPGTSLKWSTDQDVKEVFILEGIWRDELSDYQVKTWLRFPPFSEHFSSSPTGCILYVKIDKFTNSASKRKNLTSDEP